MLHGVDEVGVAGLHGAAPETASRGQGMEIDTDSGSRQIGLNNVAQTHSTSRSHTHGRQGAGTRHVSRAGAGADAALRYALWPQISTFIVQGLSF